MAYEFVADIVRGDALDNWLEIFQDSQIYQLGVRDTMSWTSHIEAFRKIFLDAEAYDNQREYLRSTKKPRNISVKDGIKRIKVINGYLPLMEVGATKSTEEELIRYVIKPNIPMSWVKDFKIEKGQITTNTLEVLGLLKAIEAAEVPDQNKYSRKNNKQFKKNEYSLKNKGGSNNKSVKKKFKIKCQPHPQGNLKWDDCFKNPNSDNLRENKKWKEEQ